MDNTRVELPDGTEYALNTAQDNENKVFYRWANEIDAPLEQAIIALMRDVTESAPVIGFSTVIQDAEAAAYTKELRENLRAGKCHLLTIYSRNNGEITQLIGLCTLRRNLNPNNKHIVDLAKGMIDKRFRGSIVLPAAFQEITLRCERDGAEIVTLDVRADTVAHRTWTKFGFETYGILNDYARADGQVFAGHFMMQRVQDLKARATAALAKIQRISAEANV